MENEFRHLHMDPNLICQFLAVFSRMEYALKSTRYAIGNDNRVDPAWDRFANDIDTKFLEISTSEISAAREYLLGRPPRKQILTNNRITFSDQVIDKSQKQTQQILLMVRTVRNNLFHGGKYLPEGEQEELRNQMLVHHSLNVLLACSRLDQDVRNSYER